MNSAEGTERRFVAASCGGGVNSKAMLIEMVRLGEKIDVITFADTGGEKPETYADVEKLSRWLVSHGYPEIITVRLVTSRAGKYRGAGEVLTLERRCLEERYLPSIAYGYKACSLRFKKEPQDKYLKSIPAVRELWAAGGVVTKLFGYDADEPQRAIESPDPKYVCRYPLIEWGWGREECVESILNSGLCVPPKSSCFFCPNMEDMEILELRDRHPDLLARALAIEANAVPTPGSSIRGLGRDVRWAEIIQFDADQGKFFPRVRPAVPCECYDG